MRQRPKLHQVLIAFGFNRKTTIIFTITIQDVVKSFPGSELVKLFRDYLIDRMLK
jgi:hypothetical protein